MAGKSVSSDEAKYLKKVGSKIRSLRSGKGWTLEQVEEHGWNNWQHLQKIESGKNITILTLKRVAALYKTTPGKILEDL